MSFYHLKKYPLLFVNDAESVDFHVQAGDYFGSLATTLSLWRQQGLWPEIEGAELEKDLLLLQKEYTIRKKLS